jgi:glutathione synthase/RimK-type ligase-like ATP-grasp enzyme
MDYDIIILTDQRYLKDHKDLYRHNVFYEDDLVLQAIRSRGLKVIRKAWDDPQVDWSQTKAVLFRSTWDYFDRFQEFLNWLKLISSKTELINSHALISWNLDKRYLLELNKKGVRFPPTEFIEKGSTAPLTDILELFHSSVLVLKPCVSGAGRHTYLLDRSGVENYKMLFQDLVAKEPMMVQEFQNNIVSRGEISLMVINGVFTHAVLKKAKSGDFRVQDDFGGTVHDYEPTEEEIQFALKAVLACPEIPVYARVDIFYGNDNCLSLGELELIEPELWFRKQPAAADVLAKAIEQKLTRDYEN